MTTLVSDIIQDAFRESNLISITAVPTTYEETEALRLLNRFRASVYGNEAGEQLDPVPIGRNNINRPQGYPWYDQQPSLTEWFVPANSRLVFNLESAAQTIYLDPNPEDGSRFAVQDESNNLSTYPVTVMGNGRLIAGGTSIIFNTDGYNAEFLYRRDTGNWSQVSPLGLTDPWPFPPEFDELFVVGLALRLNPRNAIVADSQSMANYKRAITQFRARYRQHSMQPSELALIRTPGSRRRFYDNTRLANALFNSGWASPFGGYIW